MLTMRLLSVLILMFLQTTFCVNAQEKGAAAKEPGKNKVEIKSFYPDARSIDPEMTAEEYTEYGRGSLFDYINGGAEAYLGLGFVKVGARDYMIELEAETYFTLDVYDMGETVNAFGIFCAERYGTSPVLNIGVSGYMGGGTLNFWSRRYYVKVRADDIGKAVNKILLKIARHVEKTIGDPGRLPKELELFPEKYRVPAGEKYFSGNLLGCSYLKGFSCPYKLGRSELKLVLCPYENDKEAVAIEKRFISGMKTRAIPSADGMGFFFDDKYIGNGRVFRLGRHFAVIQDFSMKEGKDGQWKTGVADDFIERITECVMQEKAQNALKSMMGGSGKKQ